jgi:hypothetical protein
VIYPLLSHVEAMDRLNSYVRSTDCRAKYYTSLHDVIYTAKGYVIRAAHDQGLASHRRVHAFGKCRRCGGSGVYRRYPSSGEADCRFCDDGHVRLDFVETTISIDSRRFVWHSPIGRFVARLSLAVVGPLSTFSTDWQPNQPGKEIPLSDLARDLNLIEQAYAAGLRQHGTGVHVLRLRRHRGTEDRLVQRHA